MMRSPKKRPPKHLEKMLFINHKEDVLLQDKLADLNLRSKLRIMDLDRERIQVRRELRNSRKKNIDVRDAAALTVAVANTFANDSNAPRTQSTKTVGRKHAISAPPGGRLSMISEDSPETAPNAEPSDTTSKLSRRPSRNKFSREPSLSSIYESFDENEELLIDKTIAKETIKREGPKERSRVNSIVDESVGAYVLGEFRRVSQVVPSILSALTSKDDEEDEILYQPEDDSLSVPLIDYEPDLHRVRKTVSAVKKLRHRMSVSRKLQAARPSKSLDQMIRERSESVGAQDEYTDGTCMLMKRRLDKRRRNSATPGLSQPPSFMQRRQSLFAKPDTSDANKMRSVQAIGAVNFPRQRNRSQSIFNLPKMTRSPTVIGLVSNTSGLDSDFSSPVIDEDEFINRQKVLREIDNYRRISVKIDEFLASHDARRAEYTHLVAI